MTLGHQPSVAPAPIIDELTGGGGRLHPQRALWELRECRERRRKLDGDLGSFAPWQAPMVLSAPNEPGSPMPEEALRIQLQMQARATTRLLGSGDWLTAEEVAQRGFAPSQVRDWEERGLLFSIEREGVSLYPAYALDPTTGIPPAGVRVALEVLQWTGHSGWRIAFWFDNPNGYLGGERPKDCLKGPLAPLRFAAEREAEGILHG